MSWVKKRGQAAPNPNTVPPPTVQMYNPNQHSTQDNQWQQQQQQQQHDNWYSQQSFQQQKPSATDSKAQNYWQQPYNQEYTQYQDQGYYQNPSYSQPQQQPYGNLQYSQQYNQNNVYSPAGEPQQQPQSETDGWGSNWGWGDEDNSNIQAPPQQHQNIVDSFANDETWNWPQEDAQKAAVPTPKLAELELPKSLPSIDRITGKRGKLETPQWSVESQVSQESSDDVLQTSESEKSRMLSRSSTISHSPISGHDLPPNSHLVDDSAQVKPDEASNLLHFENKEILGHLNQSNNENGAVQAPINTQPALLPPQMATEESKSNPYQRNGGVSHKSANKFRATAAAATTPPMTQWQSQQLPINLETLPDNAEQPDLHPEEKFRPTFSLRPENNEAPINDRNQYLETGQLSDAADLVDNPQEDTLPPPGLRRLVLGQMEQQDSSNQRNEPPEGLRRLIPGESSSPEINRIRSDESEPELNEMQVVQPRSATIGADTPPAAPSAIINRSETIGAAATSPDLQSKQKNRRDSVEGQFGDKADLGGLVNAVRSLTVGDSTLEDGKASDQSGRRQESSESEQERQRRNKSPIADRRDRRYKDEREGKGRRYSPEEYREKKYDKRRYKERRYEEDTDYYSDKERERRHREEYERKYSSLRKDKEKERKKRDYGRETQQQQSSRKSDYYYARGERERYEESYENESRSRASSRSDSVHDPYRERGHERDRRDRRHREKERHRRHRDHPRGDFNPYSQGFGYDMYNQYYQQQYHYYENLRKTNPQAYAQWYRKYYQDAGLGEAPSFVGEDRASVHSGRSSANDELAKDRYTRQSYYSQTSLPPIGSYYRGSQTHSISGQYGLDESSFGRTFDQTDHSLNFEESTIASQRLTPAKFATAHIKATISSGKLIKILPHYPIDGQPPSVEICNLEQFLSNDEEYQELKRFPGPLLKGTTHKKTILEYCDQKIKSAAFDLQIVDRDSYVLMWELLMLLIKQNGMVVGADIAELLLKNREDEVNPRPASIVSSINSNSADPGGVGEGNFELSSGHQLKEEEITNKFREYLLYGSGKEALEWAMKHGLWGHALFLASKLDKRTYGNVLMRFANGLTMNDPLQTLYQLLSGKTPAAVTCVADEKWGDWRPHLAMILSNSTQRPELNCKAITILGDTLMGRGSLYAAQFCYLMAEVGFSSYGSVDAKLVLLGSDHTSKPFLNFATNEAIHMTEIYEYACSLNNDAFSLPNFQVYKYLLATRLADMGLLERSLAYLEKIANFIVKNPGSVDGNLVNQVATLADRLKYYDPVGDADEDPAYDVNLDISRPDNSWLKDLRQVQNDYNVGVYGQVGGVQQQVQEEVQQVYGQEAWQQQPYQQQQQWSAEQVVGENNTQIEYQQQQHQPEQVALQQPEGYGYGEQQQQYWQPQQQWGDQPPAGSFPETEQSQQLQGNYYGNLAPNEQPDELVKNKPCEELPAPQISLPNQQENAKEDGGSIGYNEAKNEGIPPKPKSGDLGGQQQQEKATGGGNGWFGIFSKLSLKPKNQMKLPDDKNPSIVWDPEKKRWINTDADASEGGNEFKPPPKMSAFAGGQQVPHQQVIPPSFAAPNLMQNNPQPFANNNNILEKSQEANGMLPKSSLPQQPNMFKLQGRGRNLKKSYVDVFNPNGKAGGGPGVVDQSGLASGPASLPQMNFFIPQPVNDPNAPTDFLTPAPPLQYDENSQQMQAQ